jgi:hypothetical protein
MFGENEEKTICTAFEKNECPNCELETKLNCKWERRLLWQFQSVFSPYLFVSTIGMVLFSYWSSIRVYSIVYSCFLVVYFFFIRLKVLCSYCPYYEQKKFLEPLPKIWKYQSKPMNLFEKIVNFTGHFFLILFPATIQSYGLWYLIHKTGSPKSIQIITLSVFLGMTILTAFYYVIGLATKLCNKCVNIQCPQNRVPKNLVKLYTSKISVQNSDKN